MWPDASDDNDVLDGDGDDGAVDDGVFDTFVCALGGRSG